MQDYKFEKYVILNEHDEDTRNLAELNGERLWDNECILQAKTKEEAIDYFNKEFEKLLEEIRTGAIEKSKYKCNVTLAERKTIKSGRITTIEDVPIIEKSI
jgi:hypothetical protein